ncbi:MAG: transposase [Chloroflexota bacterium]
MHIIARAHAFVQSLRDLANRSAWDWRRCPRCGSTRTHCHGAYTRHPWFLEGQRLVRVQRHRCQACGRTYSQGSPLLVAGSWYAREVHRLAIDHWQHAGTSLRRTAEVVRSWLGRQERWLCWRPLDTPPPEAKRCTLSASTVQRWLDRAGQRAQAGAAGQLAGVPTSGQLGTDGLWTRLRGGVKRVVLVLSDSRSGLVWPPVVAKGEERAGDWEPLFARAARAGLALEGIAGLTSDGASGLVSYLKRVLYWCNHQRCVWHLWRNLGGALQAGEAGARGELVGLAHAVLDAPGWEQARAGLTRLAAHRLGAELARVLNKHWQAALVWRGAYNQGLVRTAPEWLWRDFRLRLSRGRNHATEVRLERAALVWAVYHNFTPAQRRSERKRVYRRPGKSPLEMAGVPPNGISYLDALAV